MVGFLTVLVGELQAGLGRIQFLEQGRARIILPQGNRRGDNIGPAGPGFLFSAATTTGGQKQGQRQACQKDLVRQ